MNKLRYKESTPHALNNLLLSNSFFSENWKYIPTVCRMLNQILRWNTKDNGLSSVTHEFFYNKFKDDYTTAIQALDTLGLMIVSYDYSIVKQTCNHFGLTPLCHSLLADTNREYLYQLLSDPKERRKNQVRVSKRGYNKLVYGDVRDTLKRTIDGITFDFSEVEAITNRFSDAKRASTYWLLIDVVAKDYETLKHNTKDNRVWNPFTQLPPEIKAIIKINGLSYQETIDIRSAYPSLWGDYLLSLPNLPHIEAGKVNIASELARYRGFFMRPCVDPKSVLSSLLSIPREKIKDVLIQYFNGKGFKNNVFARKSKSDPFWKFNQWLQSEFPVLYSIWLTSDVTQTGNNIGKYFETRLMLDPAIYQKAKDLGIVLGYEYDGCSLYAADNSRCDEMLEYIRVRSQELFGFSLVFVKKDNRELLSAFMATSQAELLLAEVQVNDKKLHQMRGKCWQRKCWKPYYTLKEKNSELLERLKELSYLINI